MEQKEYIAVEEHAGLRVDIAASRLSGLTRSQVQKCIEEGLLLVNGLQIKQNTKVHSGDVVKIIMRDAEEVLTPQDLQISILYQDDSLIVVNKPAGMVVYPAAGHDSSTLMNAIAYRSAKLATVGGPLRPGVVHRLDKDTSGIMVVALDDNAYYDLVEQFRGRTISREYRALIYDRIKGDRGQIASKIGRSESDRKKMSTKSRRGKEAYTTWNVMERFDGATLISARLGTGRTHQIRVHFASIAHPILGDKTYGKKTNLESGKKKIHFTRQMLHAALLGFRHPVTGQHMEFRADLPDDMQQKIDELRGL